jgi:hypothetical protein
MNRRFEKVRAFSVWTFLILLSGCARNGHELPASLKIHKVRTETEQGVSQPVPMLNSRQTVHIDPLPLVSISTIKKIGTEKNHFGEWVITLHLSEEDGKDFQNAVIMGNVEHVAFIIDGIAIMAPQISPPIMTAF